MLYISMLSILIFTGMFSTNFIALYVFEIFKRKFM